MLRNFISFIFILLSINALGQSFSISGKVIDSESNEPVPFATVSIYSSDSALINGSITEMNGKFSIPVAKGNYYLIVSFLSYKSFKSRVFSVGTDKTIDFGQILLSPNTKTLDEVLVEGQKMEMRMELDKRIFNVAQDPTNKGRNASEILENVPSVTVDAEGGVALRGSQNVRILIDGKPSGLIGIDGNSGLEMVQGNLIESIEIVTNPSVRYEAEGMAGVINIVLKKDKKKGFNGAIEANTGYPYNHGISANLNFRREKINFFVNGAANFRSRPSRGYKDQVYNYQDTTFFTDVDILRQRGGFNYNFRGGADYYFNDKNVLTASVLMRLEDGKNKSRIDYFDKNQNLLLTNHSIREDAEEEDGFTLEYALNHTLELGAKRKLTSFVQFRTSNEVEDAKQDQITEFNINDNYTDLFQRSLNEEIESNIILQSDLVIPFAKKSRFEAGLRSGMRIIDNRFEVEQQDSLGQWFFLDNFTNSLYYDEKIHAAYGLLGHEFGIISGDIGLRVEYTDIFIEQPETNFRANKEYLNAFPSAHLNLNFSKTNSVQISYSKRISRPGFWYLNPFFNFTDPRNIRSGNPDLNPEFTDSYETGYLRNGDQATFYGGAYYRFTQDLQQRIRTTDSLGVNRSFPVNLGSEDAYGLEGNISRDLTKWWNINANMNFYRSIINGTYEDQFFGRDTYTWNGRLTTRFKFWNNSICQFLFNYQAPQNTTQGEQRAFYNVDFAASKDVFKKNATLSLRVSDIFNTRKWRNFTENGPLVENSSYQRAPRQFVISFTYRINQKQKDRNRDRNSDNNFGDSDF